MSIRTLIWNEGRHEQKDPRVAEIYPHGIHGAIAAHLRKSADLAVSTATLDCDAEHGCNERQINSTDVLIWWGHMAHNDVSDAVVDRIHQRVLAGMGLIVLHSGHFSKIFKRLMGTTCDLKWREGRDREIVWVTAPGHPIAAGLSDHFIIPHEEMYGEYFDVPEPLQTVFISSFTGGEVFRTGLTYQRGAGRIFYFRPGHETHPTYHDANVLRVIENAARWCAPSSAIAPLSFGNRKEGWLEGR